ncbi:hypothetical protein Tco_1405440 [Tanacetum coccineum]
MSGATDPKLRFGNDLDRRWECVGRALLYNGQKLCSAAVKWGGDRHGYSSWGLKDIPTKPGVHSLPLSLSFYISPVAGKSKNIHWELQWELPTEFLNLPSQVSSVQEKLKILDSLPSLLYKVTDTLNRFATMMENASRATSMNVPSAGKATVSPAEGEKKTKDADTNLKDELVDLLGKNVMTRYYTKKLLFDKYCDKILKRKKRPKITKCEVLTKKGLITLKIYREDGSDEVISNLKVGDLHSREWREVIQACPDKSKKGWKTIYDLKASKELEQLQSNQIRMLNNNDLEYLKGGSSSGKYTTSTTKTKAAKYLDVIIVRQLEDLDKLYKGGKASTGIKSYQTKLNITKHETFRLMHLDELYKFYDGTLSSVRRVLHDIASRWR